MVGRKEDKRFVCQISIRGGEQIFLGRGEDDDDEKVALKAAKTDILGVITKFRKEKKAAEAKRKADAA